MVATSPIAGSANGPRPLNLNRDIPQVLALLDVVFRPTLDRDGRRMLSRDLASSTRPSFMLRLNRLTGSSAPGFVWEEDKRIVGNVSLLTTKSAGRHLIANVAVHPEFRRRGIARRLMEAALTSLKQRSAKTVLLQVERSNEHAIQLYRDLNFRSLGDTTSWQAMFSAIRPVSQPPNQPEVKQLRSREWQDAIALDRFCLPPDLDWPEPAEFEMYRLGFWRRLNNVLNGQQLESWVIRDEQAKLIAVGSIISDAARPHFLRVRVHPNYRESHERMLVAKLLRRLRYMRRRQVRIDHLASDETMNQLLQEANFRPRRTLTTMRLHL